MPRRILVLGSTSPAGIQFCLCALRDGHTLTLYVRSPNKLPDEIASSKNVTIHTGNLTDTSRLEKAITSGAKTCVSFLGPVLLTAKKGQLPITEGYATVLRLLEQHDYSRNLFVSTASYRVPEDKFAILFFLMVFLVKLFFRPAWEEINGFTPLITALPEKMNWTVFRVPSLGSGKDKGVRAAYVGGDVSVRLERKGLAEWVLREMVEGKWIGKCPALSNT